MQVFLGRKWDLASKSLNDGGIGIGNLKNRNTALLFKWNWRFLKKMILFGTKL